MGRNFAVKTTITITYSMLIWANRKVAIPNSVSGMHSQTSCDRIEILDNISRNRNTSRSIRVKRSIYDCTTNNILLECVISLFLTYCTHFVSCPFSNVNIVLYIFRSSPQQNQFYYSIFIMSHRTSAINFYLNYKFYNVRNFHIRAINLDWK